MKQLKLAAFAAPATILALLASPGTRQADDEPPPMQLEITVDGKKYEANEGQKIQVAVGDKVVDLTVGIKPTLRFTGGGVAFDYPRHMSYEFDSDFGYEMWTLDGNSCTVIVQSYDAGNAEELAELVLREGAKALGSKRIKPKVRKVKLGGKTVKAQCLDVELSGMTQAWTVLGIESQGHPLVLWIQDMVDEDGKQTAEAEALLKLLATTFTRE